MSKLLVVSYGGGWNSAETRAVEPQRKRISPITLRNADVLLTRLRGENADVLRRLLDDVREAEARSSTFDGAQYENRSPDGDGHSERLPASAHPELVTPLPNAFVGHDNREAGSEPADFHFVGGEARSGVPQSLGKIVALMRQQSDDVWHLGGHQDCARTLADYANRIEKAAEPAAVPPPQPLMADDPFLADLYAGIQACEFHADALDKSELHGAAESYRRRAVNLRKHWDDFAAGKGVPAPPETKAAP